MKNPITVSVTGAAGQIGYALLFRIASGAMFGPDQPVNLRLIEIEPGMKALEGVMMELDDCAFPLLNEVVGTCDLAEGFKGTNWALLVGSVPRGPGMERKDLLGINGKIFTGQGQAINDNASPDVRVLVVGNPCNTNALIAMHAAKDIPNNQFFAMTRLDENDFTNALIDGKAAGDVIDDKEWLEGEFISTVQQRGAAIIAARGASSAASAANAAVDTVVSLTTPTPEGDYTSVCVYSDGSYGVDEGLIASMPVRTSDGKTWEVVHGVEVNEFSRAKIDASVQELREEKEAVADLI